MLTESLLQVPNLQSTIKEHIFSKKRRSAKVVLPIGLKQKFDIAFELQPYHNPLMHYCCVYGLLHENTRYLSICTNTTPIIGGEIFTVGGKLIPYNPVINRGTTYVIERYYPQFYSKLFVDGKLEEYIREYAALTKKWEERERNYNYISETS